MTLRSIPVWLLVLAFSCGQKKVDSRKAYQFYDAVNHELSATREIQQRLVDRLLNIILLIDNDPNTKIDINPVQQMLDNAKRTNITRIKNIHAIPEFDEQIDYKIRVLDYLIEFEEFLEKDVKDFLFILQNKKGDELAEAKKMLQPKLLLVKQKEEVMKDAQEDFKYRYTRNESGQENLSPDFEYVSLSKIESEPVNITDRTVIDLVSYSGGDCDSSGLVFKQFIGINQVTKDTVRILALCAAQEYDLDKAPRSGIFRKIPFMDSATHGLMVTVVFNKNLSDIERKKYKTAFGLLEFK